MNTVATNLVPNDGNRASDVFISTLAYNGGKDDVTSSISYTLPTNVEDLSLTGLEVYRGLVTSLIIKFMAIAAVIP